MGKELNIRENRYYDLYDSPIYEGEYSKLYKAIDRKLKRTVIVKEVPVIDGRKSLLNEIGVCSSLGNYTTQVPLIMDYWEENGYMYIIMQWIPGIDLSKKLKTGIPIKGKMKYAKELCRLVSIMHCHNYEHRDLKPDNIRIGKDDRVYLLDFNLSAVRKHRGEGTDNYRAPEVDWDNSVHGNGVIDVFSIGVILYEMFTDHLPVKYQDYGSEYEDKSWRFFREPIEYNQNLYPQLNRIIVKCMKLNPRDRYQNASQVLTELYKIRNGNR